MATRRRRAAQAVDGGGSAAARRAELARGKAGGWTSPAVVEAAGVELDAVDRAGVDGDAVGVDGSAGPEPAPTPELGRGSGAARAAAGSRLWAWMSEREVEWQRAGMHPLSPWWRRALERWLTGEARGLVLRVGRRGGKSSSLCRWAVAEAVAGEHVVPAGDVGVVSVVSVERRDAGERIRTCGALLSAIGYREVRGVGGAVKKRGEYVMRLGSVQEIVLMSEHGLRAIRAFTASVSGVSGFTSIAVFADEVAKWRDEDTGVNPAEQVISSIKPTLATQPLGRVVYSSSPWSTTDAHHRMFSAGDNAAQIVAHAATWEANPTITEAETRADEPDEMLWAREYAAIPMPSGSDTFLDPRAIDDAMLAASGLSV